MSQEELHAPSRTDDPPATLQEFLGSTEANPVVAHVLDLHLIIDATFRVAFATAQPEDCDAIGHSLLDLASSPIRQGLREAAERCIATGGSERLSFRLATAPHVEYAAVMAPIELAQGTGLVLAGLADVGESVLPSDIEFQLEVQRNVLDVLDVAVFWKDRESRFLGANAKMLDALGGAQIEDVLGKSDFDYFPAEAAQGYRDHDEAVMSTGEPVIDLIEKLDTLDGKTEILVTTKLPVRNADGEVIGVTGYFRFVTDVVEAEEQIRTLEGRHALALQASNEGVWEYDVLTQEIEVNERYRELVGLEPALDRRVSVKELAQLFGSEAVKDFIAQSQAVIADPTTHIDQDLLSIETESGTRWFENTGYPLVQDGVVTRLLGTMAERTDEVQREQDLLYRATHDDLTGLANRRLLLERLGEELEANESTFLLYLDLDQFKIVNDSLGHGVGDELLQVVSGRLSTVVADKFLLARLGGDEFAIVGASVGSTAESLAESILEALSVPLVLGETEIYTSASIGLVYAAGKERGAVGVLRDADTALYEAKAAGKSCIRIFETEMRLDAERQLERQSHIRRALANDEFELHYQPIFSSTTGSISGVEALLRWNTGDELVSPAIFLPYLEQSGLIIPVGEQVIADAVAQLATWIRTIPKAKGLVGSLNLSRVQFRSPELVDVLLDAIREHDVPPTQLVVEVTETAVSDDITNMAETLNRIRETGIRVAVDDFGVGQSSLNSLYELPADILKIDRAFVNRIDDSASQPVLEAILQMAHAVGLEATAEGVETETQREFLELAGCDYLQGYLLGRPTGPDQMAELLRQLAG